MYRTLTLVLALVFFLSACTGATPVVTATPMVETTESPTATATTTSTTTPTHTPTLKPSLTPTPAPVDYSPGEFPEDVNPLTGLNINDEALLERKPIAVKIQLFPRFGRPPFGLNSADLVYEFYQNNGITRLHAIFYGQDAEQVGPIRSARFLDHDLITMYKSVFAYGSADWRVNQRLMSAPYASYLVLEGAETTCPPTVKNPLCRFDPAGQSLLLTGTNEITEYIRTEKKLADDRPDLEAMRFTSEAPADGEEVAQVSVKFSLDLYHRWEYDEASGRYLRYQDTQTDDGTRQNEGYELLTDRVTGDAISTANVVVLLAPHSYFFRSSNNELIEIALTGTGTAYAFRDGQAYKVTWQRSATDKPLTLLNADGSLFAMKPGNTWFSVIGTASEITTSAEEGYHFRFSIP